MGKYLIQDIVPPERKHSSSAKKATSTTHAHTETHHTKTLHHEDAAHAPKHHKTPLHDEILVAEVDDINNTEPIKDPHTMISSHMEIHEDSHSPKKEIDTPPLALTDEIADKNVGVGAWPYNNDNIPTSSHSNIPSFRNTPPPHFPETSGSDASRGGNLLSWILIPLVGVGVVVFMLNFFSGATITLIAKENANPIDHTFTALHKDKAGEELSYSVITATSSDALEVPATGTKTVTTKASGKIIVYNEQSTPQRLIKNTRFESVAGKIYRINESITVPKTIIKGGKKTLGTLEVTVYADEAGAEYNSDPTDFTVPGLKNTPQEKMVYARSRGTISGGASGTIKSVSDQDLKKATDDIRVSLETKLRNKAHNVLAGFAGNLIAYDQGVIVDLKDPILSNEQASSADKAVVTEAGSISMIVFERAPLTKAVAKAAVPTYGGEEVLLNNLENLSFTTENLTSDTLISEQPINFSLKGTPQLKWVIEQDAIKKDLLGLLKTDFNSKMAAYPTIERAKASLRPFWKQRFPTDPTAISIKIVEQITE